MANAAVIALSPNHSDPLFATTLFKAKFLNQAQHPLISRPRLRIDILDAFTQQVLNEQIPDSCGISLTAR